MTLFGDSENSNKNEGKNAVIKLSESKMRSWIQRRACELHREKFGVTGTVNNDRWSECVRQATQEWEKHGR